MLLPALTLALLASAPSLDVSPRPQAPAPADSAVVIGVADYAFLQDVPYADRDARAFARYLVQGRGVPSERVQVLVDKRAARETVEAMVRAAVRDASPEGTLWLYFAGHGMPSPDGRDALLAGADAQATIDSLAARSVSRRWLLDELGRSHAGRVVVVFDACFTGKDRVGGSLLNAGERPVLPASVDANTGARVLVFSAASADETSGPFDRVKQGLFSYFVVGGLRGWADADGDRSVTARELADYARRGVGTVLSDGSRSQTPGVNARAGDARLDWALATGVAEAAQGPDLQQLSAAGGDALVVSAQGVALGDVPQLSGKLSAGGGIRLNTRPEVLEAYDAAVQRDAEGRTNPGAAAAAWERLFAMEGDNPFRADAGGRARQWREYEAKQAALAAQLDEDTRLIRRMLPLGAVPMTQKVELLAAYLASYGANGFAPLMALLPTDAARRQACAGLVQAGAGQEVEVLMPYVDGVQQQGKVAVDGLDAASAPGRLRAPPCARRLRVRDARGNTWETPLALPASGEPLVLRPAFAYVDRLSFNPEWQAAAKVHEAQRARVGRVRRLGTSVLAGGLVMLAGAAASHFVGAGADGSVRNGGLATAADIEAAHGKASTFNTLKWGLGAGAAVGISIGLPLRLLNPDTGEYRIPEAKSATGGTQTQVSEVTK